MTFPKKQTGGLTIVETLIYIGIFVIALTVIVQMMFSLTKTHRLVKLKQSLEASGTISMERMLREIRNATSIDMVNSALGSSPGKLVLTGTDENGNNYTLEFSIANGAIMLSKNGASAGPLTTPGISATSLVFRNISNSVSSGVRIELSLSGAIGTEIKNLDLFGFAILRNSY
ncbi:MAG: hypothetical protein AAB861_04120 [Patescibacteria group bacterium]